MADQSLNFDEIYARYGTRLYTLAYRITGRREDAEDALQSACLQIAGGISGFRHESALYTWLYTIVQREARKHAVRQRRLPVDVYAQENNLTLEEVFAHVNALGETEDVALTNAAREQCLQVFMNCMPPTQRVVFTLRVILRCTVNETAQIMDMSPGAVSTSLHRGRALIASFLEGRCSLYNPENPCKCSSWALYCQSNPHKIKETELAVIRESRQALAVTFKHEVGTLMALSHIYNARFGPDSPQFSQKLTELLKSDMTLLGAQRTRD
ncbi:RNA polymerase sigma factor [Myxococcota bacterium]|nr:RNA polymerase sigma factor [Myxococcota bacterium]MBU1537088.1 RNA polymerase sigma factor [Myxococcota bacterium]